MATVTTAQTFNFEFVSPEARLISEAARMVAIPGETAEAKARKLAEAA